MFIFTAISSLCGCNFSYFKPHTLNDDTAWLTLNSLPLTLKDVSKVAILKYAHKTTGALIKKPDHQGNLIIHMINCPLQIKQTKTASFLTTCIGCTRLLTSECRVSI